MLKRAATFSILVQILTVSLYCLCLSCLLYVFFTEQYWNYSRNLTQTVNGLTDTSQFDRMENLPRYPTLVVCQYPGFKLENPFHALAKDALPQASLNFTAFIEETTFYHAGDLISSFSVGENLASLENVTTPFRRVMTECLLCGYCFAADFKEHILAVRESAPTAHSVTFSLRLRSVTVAENPSYLLYVVDQGEEMVLAGASNLRRDTGIDFVSLLPGQAAIINIETAFHERMRECEHDDRVRLSTCVGSYLSKAYGQCDSPEKVPSAGCNASVLARRCLELATLKLEGYEYLHNKTGCHIPCRRFVHTPRVVIKDDIWKVEPSSHVRGSDHTVARFRYSEPRKMPHIREELSYSLFTFLGEVGGIGGLILGLSVWSVFEAGISVLRWIHRKISQRLSF